MKNKITYLRRKRGIKQDKICKEAQISKKTLYNYEHGLNAIPSDVLLRLARLFDCSVDYLLGIKKYTTITVKSKSGEVIAHITNDQSIEHKDYTVTFGED